MKSKYHNKKIIIDGIEFDSEKEGNRYIQLKMLKKAGMIKDLQLQVPYVILDGYKKNGKTIRAITYKADFVYYDIFLKKTIVEDTKGYRTEVYKLKKKMFESRYPELEITEI